MAAFKFEDHLKDKLEKRSLAPSSESWSKLSERLDADEKKSRSSVFWWLGSAAAVLIMIAVVAQFYGVDTSEDLMPQVVEETVNDKPGNYENAKPKIKKIMPFVVEDSSENQKEKAALTNDNQILIFDKLANETAEPKTKLAETDQDLEHRNERVVEKHLNMKLRQDKDALLIEHTVAEVLKTFQVKNSTVSDREIDSLLKQAHKALFKEKLQKESAVTVDAQALLMSVQDEMGQSFRSKVLEALMDSYETVKTAVAQRNN